jgi:hypothetical protein
MQSLVLDFALGPKKPRVFFSPLASSVHTLARTHSPFDRVLAPKAAFLPYFRQTSLKSHDF